MNRLVLKPGKEKALLRRHPWIFSGALTKIPAMTPGELAHFCAADGTPLATGYVNPNTQLCGRILSFDPREKIDAGFWRQRLAAALERREDLLVRLGGQSTGCRLVMSESDGLPGLIVDLYGSWLVVQVLTAGIDRVCDQLWEPLWNLTEKLLARVCDRVSVLGQKPQWQLEGIFEKSDDAMRELEGLQPKIGIRKKAGAEPPGDLPNSEVMMTTFLEDGTVFSVDLEGGQKTGAYHDQRENHFEIGRMAKGKKVLDCCSYRGGFALAALNGGASEVVCVDQSGPALEGLRTNIALNQKKWDSHPLPIDARIRVIQKDAFQALRDLHTAGEVFDLVILDPPKFAARQSQVDRAARGYKDLNLWGAKLVRPGGHLATFSCSGHIDPDLFQKIVFGALLDANKNAQIVRWFHQSEDHPVLLSFPESHYLKGLLVRVENAAGA
jgi:23S rRNA (cytosine1962-C5)-methyltransferase